MVLTADGNAYGRDRSSWVSNRRRTMGEEELASRPKTPAVALPDGGAFLVTEHGEATILNADGSLRARLDLPGDYKLAPLAARDGTIVVTSEDKYLHAVGPDGALLWTHVNAKNYKVSAVLDEDNPLFPEGVVYAVDEDGVVSALNMANGQVYWSLACKNLVPEDPGKVKGRPVVGQDGRLFVVSEKGYLFALMPQAETAVLDWAYRASGDHFEYAAMIGANEIIYLPHENGVTAVTPSGTPAFNLVTEKHVTAQPILMADSTLLVPAEKYLYALNPDGQVRFRFLSPAGGKFEAPPVVSPDQSQIYAPLKEKQLFALNAINGELLWSYNSSGDLKASPVVESNGDIHLSAADGRYTILSPAGQILFQKQLPGDLRVSPTLSAGEKSIFLPAESMTIEALALLPDSWDGVPDVRATDDPRVWDFASPVTIDVGADVLHDGQLNGKASLSGAGVTVAVVDSGVYFDRDVKAVLGSEVEHLFLGQADFTNDGQCPTTNGDVVQYSGYCWTNHKASGDPYGHGSHVAGIIWNHFQDADTQVNLGIAPGAKIISIRVLNQEGVGTYEEVINGIQFAVAHKDEYNIRVMNLSLSGLVTSPYFADPLNQAVEAAWAKGIVVLAAAGNTGAAAQSITVPGNDPYIITVGAVDSKRTAGYWGDDLLPSWASAGPTFDGFIKPDIVAPGSNVVSFMYNSPDDFAQSAYLVRHHPDYAETMSLFRMNGTSMATAVTSGVVALMLEAHPAMTPDQVKYRLMASARSAMTDDQEPVFSVLQQGAGRLWAPDAVYGDLPPLSANDAPGYSGRAGAPLAGR